MHTCMPFTLRRHRSSALAPVVSLADVQFDSSSAWYFTSALAHAVRRHAGRLVLEVRLDRVHSVLELLLLGLR